MGTPCITTNPLPGSPRVARSSVTPSIGPAGGSPRTAKYDQLVIAEQFIEGSELTAGILGNTPLPLIRLETTRDFYDYHAKYVADDTRYIVPCGLPPDAERSVQHEALRAFKAIGCRGWGRVDVMLNRAGKPEDIADAVLFFASDRASWITGQILPVTGSPLA